MLVMLMMLVLLVMLVKLGQIKQVVLEERDVVATLLQVVSPLVLMVAVVQPLLFSSFIFFVLSSHRVAPLTVVFSRCAGCGQAFQLKGPN